MRKGEEEMDGKQGQMKNISGSKSNELREGVEEEEEGSK